MAGKLMHAFNMPDPLALRCPKCNGILYNKRSLDPRMVGHAQEIEGYAVYDLQRFVQAHCAKCNARPIIRLVILEGINSWEDLHKSQKI